MATANETRLVLEAEGFKVSEYTAKKIRRIAGTLHRAHEAQCNGHPAMGNPHIPIKIANELQTKFEARWERREKRAENELREITMRTGIKFRIGGDPRGYAVSIIFPSGRNNSWGGSENGWGIY